MNLCFCWEILDIFLLVFIFVLIFYICFLEFDTLTKMVLNSRAPKKMGRSAMFISKHPSLGVRLPSNHLSGRFVAARRGSNSIHSAAKVVLSSERAQHKPRFSFPDHLVHFTHERTIPSLDAFDLKQI